MGVAIQTARTIILSAFTVVMSATFAQSGTSVPLGANFTIPHTLISGYYNVVRGATSPEASLTGVTVDATYADIAKLLRGTEGFQGANAAKTEDALKPFVYETQEIHYLNEDLAIKAGYLTASASKATTTIYIIERWSKFVNVVIANGGNSPAPIKAKVGFSLTLVTRASSDDASLDLNGLVRNLTFEASRSKLTLTSHTEVMGLSGKAITQSLPSASDFLKAQADATIKAVRERQDVGRARNAAFLDTSANFFKTLRSQVWDASYVQPVIIAIDEDDLKKFPG
ncbi:MAG TPA: hypothetical protein PLS15_00215 [Fimbriimonadaceae bacterium]|nr:hypothetical protein [Fimbriimonadaceae bacterium]HRE94384.1 hypothetical protein [Fimbriimonadaceae bacterium]